MKKVLVIKDIKQYLALIDNRIGLRYISKVVFDKKLIGLVSLIEGINFCEEVEVSWDIE